MSEGKAQLDKLRAEATEHDVAAVAAYKNLRESRWEMAKHLSVIKDQNLFNYIDNGYPDFDAYRKSREIGRTTCFQAIRFWNELSPHIPEETLAKVTKENAEQLCRLPIDCRKDPEIIEKALTQTDEQLTAVVDTVVAKHVSKNNGVTADVPESRVPFKVNLYLSQKTFVCGVLKDILLAEKMDETDLGKGLELACARMATVDLRDQDKVLANVVIDLRRINDYMEQSEDSADQQLEWVKDAFLNALLLATGKKVFNGTSPKAKTDVRASVQ